MSRNVNRDVGAIHGSPLTESVFDVSFDVNTEAEQSLR